MILDDGRSHFIYVCSPVFPSLGAPSYMRYKGKRLTNQECLDHWGKWLVLDTKEKLDELAKKLNPYVEREEIPIIKYDRHPPANLGGETCVMLVFCDDRQQDEVWEILAEVGGVTMKAWVYDRQTMEMWMPGGVLLENWISEQGLEGEEAERVREDARRRFSAQFGEGEKPCSGWEINIDQSGPS